MSEGKPTVIVLMGVSVLVFFLLPWLDRSPVKSIRYRGPLYKGWLAAFVIVFLVLGYLGIVPTTVWGQFPVREGSVFDALLDTKDVKDLLMTRFPQIADAIIHIEPPPRDDDPRA